MSISDALLKLDRLCAGYERRIVVNQASFEIPAGKLVALLGANGAGKTTLLKTAIGLLPRLSGKCWLAGQEAGTLSARERARRVAWVPQQADTAWHYTVREIICQGRYAHLGPFAAFGPDDEKAVQNAMSMMDIEDFAERSIQQLSGGEARRVLIARALAQDTPLLALDEPAAHLDPGRQIELMQLLQSFAAAGKGILVSVHDVNAARRFADYVVLIDSKGTAWFDSTDRVLTVDRLCLAFDTRFVEGTHTLYGDYLLPLERLHGNGRNL